jgi:hypothetical protein
MRETATQAETRGNATPEPPLPHWIRSQEAAALLVVSRRRLRELMRAGVLIEGLHFTRPAGLGPRFRREMLERYLAGEDDVNRDRPLRITRPRCKVNLAAVEA